MPRARPQAPHFDRVCELRGRPAAQRSSSQVPLRTPYTSLDCIQGKKGGYCRFFVLLVPYRPLARLPIKLGMLSNHAHLCNGAYLPSKL